MDHEERLVAFRRLREARAELATERTRAEALQVQARALLAQSRAQSPHGGVGEESNQPATAAVSDPDEPAKPEDTR